MRKTRYPESRAIVAKMRAEMARQKATSSQIADAIIAQHWTVLQTEAKAHFKGSLIKLINEQQGTAPPSSPAQIDMFERYEIRGEVSVPAKDGEHHIQYVDDMNFEELQQYLSSLAKPKKKRNVDRRALELVKAKALFDDVAPLMATNPSMTVAEALAELSKRREVR